MRRLTGLLVIALVAAPGYVRADDAKKTPAADAKKDPPKDAAKDPPKDAAKDPPKDAAKDAASEAAKETGGATAEVKVGTGVENREIVGEAATFPTGTTVWVWSRVLNGEGNVKHVWKRDGKDVWTATLKVGSKRWSTQSRRAIPGAGSWTVDVQTEAGASLGTVSFTVQ
jgi:pyruvate/2-oxoglutarate dehydrogenase complex dihydrolipoamide acyltransferase (E2) component